jgi:hypothetical protein
MELAHLPYRRGQSFEDYLGEASLEKRGHDRWEKHVFDAVAQLTAALEPDYVVDRRRKCHQTDHLLEMLKPDLWFGFHTEYFDMESKLARLEKDGVDVFVDPEGYREFIAGKKRDFDNEVDLEMGVIR